MDFEIDNLDGWKEVIKSILPHLKHNILLLKGNLGAGKTTFTKYLLEEMGSTIHQKERCFILTFIE